MNKTEKRLPYRIQAGTYLDCYFIWNSTDPDELDEELGELGVEDYLKFKVVRDKSQVYWKEMSIESYGFHKELRNEN